VYNACVTPKITAIQSPVRKPGRCALTFYATRAAAGFPSPADDYVDQQLNLHEHLVEHPAATFFVRVSGASMVGAGIHDGDLLVVDRSIEPRDGHVVIAVVRGELTVKRLRRRQGRLHLVSDSDAVPPLAITEEMDLRVWGVCRYVIHGL
jgi:DNA polymerase V